MPDSQGSVDIANLARTLLELGPYAIECIKAIKKWGKGKEAEEYAKTIVSMQQKIRVLVGCLLSYRLLNLHITQIFDDAKDVDEKLYLLKEQGLSPKKISSILKKDLFGSINYYKQNLEPFDTHTLDRSHASHIGALLNRVGDLLSTACTNLENSNIDLFLKDNNSVSRECSSIRGETFFAIDKLGEQFRRL